MDSMKWKLRLYFPICLLTTFFLASCALRSVGEKKTETYQPVQGYGSLDQFPFREAWYGMYFQDEKIGYSHFKIETYGSSFRILSDSVMRLATAKKTDEIEMKERITVRPDLSMISFESLVHINNKQMRMTGKSESNQLRVDISVGDQTLERSYPLRGEVFHSSAISLMPALRGLKEGESYSFFVFNAEKQRVDKVEQQIFHVAGVPGPKGAVWKAKNIYGGSVVYSWLDDKGLTVIEKGLGGALITLLEDASTAKDFMDRKHAPRVGQVIEGQTLSKENLSLENPGGHHFMESTQPSVDEVLKCQSCATIIPCRDKTLFT